MNGARSFAAGAFLLLLAGVLQGRGAHFIRVGGAQPDFILVALACVGTLLGGNAGTVFGVFAGVLTAALVPITFGSFLASRTLAGALAAFLHDFLTQRSPFVPPLACAAVTLAAELTYVLMAPTHHLRAWAGTVGGEVLYNSLLALPVSALLRRLAGPRAESDPFARYG